MTRAFRMSDKQQQYFVRDGRCQPVVRLFCWVRFAHSLVFCVVFYWLSFVFLSFLILLVIVLSVLLTGFRKCISGADPGFQVSWAERRELRKGLGYFVWKITILRKKIIFFRILEGAPGAPPPSPLDPPLHICCHHLKPLT
jgi:hypothetical protein